MKEENNGVFFFSSQKKKKKNKKPIEKKKNVEKGGSLPFLSHFYIWDEVLLLPSPLHIPSTLISQPSSSLVLKFPRSSVLFKCGSSPELWKWSEWEMR
jgi:hypothetical protein